MAQVCIWCSQVGKVPRLKDCLVRRLVYEQYDAGNSIHSEHIAPDGAHRLEVDTSLTSPDLHRSAVSRIDWFANVSQARADCQRVRAGVRSSAPTVVAQGASSQSKRDAAAQEPPLMEAMTTELHRAIADLGSATEPVGFDAKEKVPAQKPYFISYSVADAESVTITSQYGAIMNSTEIA